MGVLVTMLALGVSAQAQAQTEAVDASVEAPAVTEWTAGELRAPAPPPPAPPPVVTPPRRSRSATAPTESHAAMREGWWWQAWFAGVSGFVLGGMGGAAIGCGLGTAAGEAGCIAGAIGGAVIGGGLGMAAVVNSVGDDAGGNGTFWAAYLGQAAVGIVGGLVVSGLLAAVMDNGVRPREWAPVGLLLAIGLFGPPAGAVAGYELSNDH